MQEEVRRYAEKLLAEKGIDLQVRVGVTTGEVVVRTIKTGATHTKYSPIGHSGKPRVALAGARGSSIDRDQRCGAQAGRGLLHKDC